MPEYGLHERPQRSDDCIPADFCIDLRSFETQERERLQREQRAQESAILAERQFAKSHSELKRIADAAERRATLAEQEAASARKDAGFSKVLSILALLVSMGSLSVAILSFIFR